MMLDAWTLCRTGSSADSLIGSVRPFVVESGIPSLTGRVHRGWRTVVVHTILRRRHHEPQRTATVSKLRHEREGEASLPHIL
jgi:hypothetical protein